MACLMLGWTFNGSGRVKSRGKGLTYNYRINQTTMDMRTQVVTDLSSQLCGRSVRSTQIELQLHSNIRDGGTVCDPKIKASATPELSRPFTHK